MSLAVHLHFRPGSDRRSLFSSVLEHIHDADDVFRIIDAEVSPYSKVRFTMKRRINWKVVKATTIQNFNQAIIQKGRDEHSSKNILMKIFEILYIKLHKKY